MRASLSRNQERPGSQERRDFIVSEDLVIPEASEKFQTKGHQFTELMDTLILF